MRSPNLQRGETGDGYVYYRTRARGVDVTVYEHQVMALHDHGGEEVFDEGTDVHHHPPARDVNVPNLEGFPQVLSVEESDEHRSNGGDVHERNRGRD